MDQVIRPISVGELRRMEFPPENYIVSDGLLGKTGIMMVGGPPKSYKSFLVQTIMLELLAGRNLFGTYRLKGSSKETVFNVTAPQRVLFLEQEVGLYDIKNRIEPAVQTFTKEEQDNINENLLIVSQDHTMRLDTFEGCTRIAQLIEETKPQVVVFDPLIEFHTSDESDAQEMGKVMWNVSALRNKYQFATIITHHTSKPNQQRKREGPDQLRGSSVIFGKGDSFLMLEPGNRNLGKIKVDFTIRRGKPISPLTVRLDRETLVARFDCWNNGRGRMDPEQ